MYDIFNLVAIWLQPATEMMRNSPSCIVDCFTPFVKDLRSKLAEEEGTPQRAQISRNPLSCRIVNFQLTCPARGFRDPVRQTCKFSRKLEQWMFPRLIITSFMWKTFYRIPSRPCTLMDRTLITLNYDLTARDVRKLSAGHVVGSNELMKCSRVSRQRTRISWNKFSKASYVNVVLWGS